LWKASIPSLSPVAEVLSLPITFTVETNSDPVFPNCCSLYKVIVALESAERLARQCIPLRTDAPSDEKSKLFSPGLTMEMLRIPVWSLFLV
jgi:hypothetical protein